MAKSIRISERDKKEYAKLVKNARAKIRNVNKKYGVDLTNEIDIPKLENFQSRKEFNKWKERQSSFLNRNNLNYQFVKNEYGVVSSKARINKIQRDVKRAQNLADKLNKETAKKSRVVGGNVVGTLGQKMLQMAKPNLAGITRPKDFDFKNVRFQSRLDEIENNMERRSNPKFRDERTERMRDRYIQKLQDVFHSDAHNLIVMIKDMNVEEFYDMYQMIDEFDFNEIYIEQYLAELGQTNNDLVERLESYVVRYKRGDFPSLKGF